MGALEIGCSGWQYRDWRGDLYPEGVPQRAWLAHYARSFTTVEVNATYYRLPTREAVLRWTQEVPPGFRFAVKVSRYLTHVRRLREVAEGTALLLDRLEPMTRAGMLGPLLWQLPPTFRRDDERLADALAAMPRHSPDGAPLRHALEVRHPSWCAEPVWELLRVHGVAAVVPDDARRPLPPVPRTADFGYVRLHYGRRGRRGNYSATELDEWAERLREHSAGEVTWVYLNNDWEGFAPRNALRLRELLGGAAAPAPSTLAG